MARYNPFITRVSKVVPASTTTTIKTSDIKSDVWTEIYLIRLNVSDGTVATYEAGIETGAGRYSLLSGSNLTGRVSYPFYTMVRLPFGARAYVTVTNPTEGTTVELVMFGCTRPKEEG